MKISELFEVIEVKVPDTDIVIKMKTEMSWFEQIEYAGTDDSTERGKFLLTSLIERWNIEDEAGKKLPITKEVVGRLPARIILPMMEAVNEKTKEKNVKKKT